MSPEWTKGLASAFPLNQKSKVMEKVTLNRRFLVETLENLLTDEFDSSELVYETDEQLIIRIIQAAEYYKEQQG